MRLTPWLSLLSKSPAGGKKTRNQLKRPRRSVLNQLERLEDRLLLSTLYVDDNLVVTGDVGPGGLSAGDTVTFASGELAEQTGLTFGSNAFSTIEAAVAAAQPTGDDILVATGTYVRSGVLNVDKSVTITGVGDGVDDVVILKSGLRTYREDRVIEILAPSVTISHLKVGGWQNAPTIAADEVGSGYDVWTTRAFTTLDNVHLSGDDVRGAVYFASSNFTLKNSVITGTYFRGAVRGGGDLMTISYNKFEESHYWYSPIYLDAGAAISGTIDHNYFANRVGVNNQFYGNFKEDGTGLNAITNYVPQNTTAAGLTIEYNTFDFQDSNLVNSSGASPSSVGVYISPGTPPGGPINVQNNIFQGYEFTGNVPTDSALPQWHPGGGVFGGALEFDGINDYGTFVSTFEMGTTGTLSFWVKLDDVTSRSQFIEGPGNAGFEFQYRPDSNGQFFGRTTTVGADVVIRAGNDSNSLERVSKPTK